MKLFLLKDIPQVGIAGEIIKVSDGYALNYLIPRNLGVKITEKNEKQYQAKILNVENRKEAISTETSLFAEKIKNMNLTIKRKMHDDDRLYGAISPHDIVDLMGQQGIKISKNQVIFDKAIKKKGAHTVTVKLSSRLQPTFNLKVVAE